MKFRNLIFVPILAISMSACQTNDWRGEEGWNGPPAVTLGWSKSLPRDSSALGETGAEGMVRNAVALSNQKRFFEARSQLAALREHQAPRSQGFVSLTAAMAVISLKSGDVAGFRRLTRQIDTGKVRVDPAVADIIAISRFLEGKSLPVNTLSLRNYLKTLRGPAAKTALAR